MTGCGRETRFQSFIWGQDRGPTGNELDDGRGLTGNELDDGGRGTPADREDDQVKKSLSDNFSFQNLGVSPGRLLCRSLCMTYITVTLHCLLRSSIIFVLGVYHLLEGGGEKRRRGDVCISPWPCEP